MCDRHRTTSLVPRFIGCSTKDSAALSVPGARQSNIMQYLRKIMSEPPPSPSKYVDTPMRGKNGEFEPVQLNMTPLDGSTLDFELNGVISTRDASPSRRNKLSTSKKILQFDLAGSEHESCHGSLKSLKNRPPDEFYKERKQSGHKCPACAGDTLPTPEPLVFG